MVEVTGFEPATFWSRTKRATKLRYTSKNGANEGTRTPDLLITNQLLYQLSYIGILRIVSAKKYSTDIWKSQSFSIFFFDVLSCSRALIPSEISSLYICLPESMACLP